MHNSCVFMLFIIACRFIYCHTIIVSNQPITIKIVYFVITRLREKKILSEKKNVHLRIEIYKQRIIFSTKGKTEYNL